MYTLCLAALKTVQDPVPHRTAISSAYVSASQGILSPEDARKAVDTGVDGIVVSNHGGRQLDYSPATLDMIAPIRAAVGHRVPLIMDGGIRRGTDVLKVTRQSTMWVTDVMFKPGFCLMIRHHESCSVKLVSRVHASRDTRFV